MTSKSRRIDASTTSFQRCVPAGKRLACFHWKIEMHTFACKKDSLQADSLKQQ